MYFYLPMSSLQQPEKSLRRLYNLIEKILVTTREHDVHGRAYSRSRELLRI